MKRYGRILAAVISCVMMNTSGVLTSFADYTEADTTVYSYNNINSSESKVSETDSLPETQYKQSEDVPFNVFNIMEAHKEYVDNQNQPSIYRNSLGIDVSQWQGYVDWSKVKASGIDYAIIRAGYGKCSWQEDPKFDVNMKGAQEAGLDCGTYWYSYALTVEEAVEEAEACYEVIKDYDFTYPVYFDIEDPSQSHLSTVQTSAIIEAFCTTLQSKGYYVGLYSYANLLSTKVFSTVLEKYPVWVAHYGVEAPDYAGQYGMWQYTSTGWVDGINGNVDMNYAYVNYPYIISPDTYKEKPDNPDVPGIAPPVQWDPVEDSVAEGIDVSFWQGDIDWNAVAESGVDYAIIRAGYGNLVSQRDTKFVENINGAKAAGLDCGVYWYSYAASPEDAILEAQACYEVIKDYQFEYPVYFDIEDPVFNGKSAEELTEITNAFCSYLESMGYYVGITSYSSFLNTRLDSSIFEKFDVWIAHYGVSRPDYYGNFGMWQYSSTGYVNGIYTAVDLNHCYYDYPTVMKENFINGF